MYVIKESSLGLPKFHFVCRCGCEWLGECHEVKFGIPLKSPNDLYMLCPRCKRNVYTVRKEYDGNEKYNTVQKILANRKY